MATHNTNVVYIDTNLDTRFALLVSDLDTVSDLKKSILLEHPLCFPQIGQIQIHGIKVEREGHFYHLVDSMPLRSAFTGSNKSWLVSVDATVLRECSQNNHVATVGIANNVLISGGDNAIGSPSKRVSTFGNFKLLQLENKLAENEEDLVPSPCVSQHTGKGAVEKLNTGVKSPIKNNELPGSAIEFEVDGTNKGIMGAVSNVNSKHKSKNKKKNKDTVREDTSKVNDTSVVGLFDCMTQQDIEVVAKPSENADKEVMKEIEVLKEHQHTDCNNNNTMSDIDTAVAMKEASKPELTAKKKGKKRKRSLTVDSKEVFTVEKAAQENEVHKSDEAYEERKESKYDFELQNEKYRDDVEYKHDKVTGDILNTITPAKKKLKSKEKSGEKSLSKAKLINDFNVNISSSHDLVEISLYDQLYEGDTTWEKGENNINMDKTNIDNMETGTDACKEGIKSAEKTTGNYMNHSDIEAKAHAANVDGSMELTEDDDKSEADQVEGAEEGIEVSPQNDPKLMLLQKSTPSIQDNIDAKIGALNVTSKVVDVNRINESIKSEKEKNRKRKTKNLGGGSALRGGIGLVDASENETVIMKSLGATNCDPTLRNTETGDNPLNQTEGGKIQEEETNAESTCKRQRKKSNNKQTSISKSIFNRLPKDQVLDGKNSSPSPDHGRHSKSSVAVTKKSNSASTKSPNKSRKANVKPRKDSIRLEPSDSRINSGSKDAVQRTIHSPEEKDDDNLEAPSKTLKVNADQHLSSCKQPDEELVDKLNGTKMKDIETMARNNMHQLEATNGQTPAEDLSSSQKLSSKEELDVRIHPVDKVQNAHRTGQDSKVSGRTDSAVIEENKKIRLNAYGKKRDLKKQRSHVPVSNSKLEGSIKMVQNKIEKAFRNKILQKKSLLSGAIFKDDSSSSSEYEVDNSDASTRTPSDNPLLSDFSDGDSSSGMDSQLDETKGMSIDDVLRSSSWFKKAKITASQLQESQSQPPEFVPDSLAD
ncbi:unnamed protein product [Sphenostylis stenocarpa]|uniref:Uncharacterized protein n=1 Tax=Sphenostylis stenocarpa TaxID=92480 RepID=A0AA86RS54_9FABA|nr:unnamed protein product [Sphenostylis stenocarpa]